MQQCATNATTIIGCRKINAFLPERQLDVLSGSVLDQFASAVWRHKRDGPFGFESAQPDTLMELDVVDGNNDAISGAQGYMKSHKNLTL